MQLPFENFKKWYHDHQDQIQRDFLTFLSFPSISTNPQYKQETHHAAEWLNSYLKQMGLESELWETTGHPIVFASYLKAGKDRPTVLLYHHYDVQPIDPIELWDSNPFVPVIKNNQVFARGASDNKGQCFYSINAIRAFLELSQKIGINLKIFIEGEEESGGSGTATALPKMKEKLKADYLLVVDLDLPAPDVPAVTIGMRGILAMEVALRNSSVDLHSGMHGGIALNPNRALVTMLSKLWDENGKVAVPGFYDGVRSFSKEILSKLDMTFDKEHYAKSFGVKAFAGEKGFSPLESNWIRPTLEINGITGGYSGIGFKTVIPSKAEAKLSCRLVADQNPIEVGKKISDFLYSIAPHGIEVHVNMHHSAKAFCGSPDSVITQISAKAFEEVFNKPCRLLLCGASVPIVTDLAECSGAEVALIGMGLADDNIHAPNEHFGLDRFEKGFLVIGRILSQLEST
jgi:acetylornithine deacetylase/succinyl-diaminopimelate desuccinylase-like protein